MGTNFYVRKNYCECCKRSDREYHIGKSSYGWAFSFQAYPWNKLSSWKDWKEFLKTATIIDEYGEVIPYEKFVAMVETYKAPNYVRDDGFRNKSQMQYSNGRDWVDEDGYYFTEGDFS